MAFCSKVKGVGQECPTRTGKFNTNGKRWCCRLLAEALRPTKNAGLRRTRACCAGTCSYFFGRDSGGTRPATR
jgi:hypothetical protein